MKSSRTRIGVGLGALAAVVATGAGLTVTPIGETVAAYADQELGVGNVTAGKMNMQGNTTSDISPGSSGWTDHFTTSNAALFQPAVATVIPGSTRSYSRFGLRLASGTSDNARVTVAQGTQILPSIQANLFRMRLVRTTSPTCDLTTFGSTASFLVGSAGDLPANFGTMLATPAAAPGGQFTLPSSGVPVFLCYEFSLPETPPTGLTNGATATVRWTVNAESIA